MNITLVNKRKWLAVCFGLAINNFLDYIVPDIQVSIFFIQLCLDKWS